MGMIDGGIITAGLYQRSAVSRQQHDVTNAAHEFDAIMSQILPTTTIGRIIHEAEPSSPQLLAIFRVWCR
jgi:hypothetical protein